jgi:hypothetical protein
MSCYFYVLCLDCERYVPAASTHGGVASGLAGDEYLRPFLVAHVGHCLTVVSEHDDEALAGCVDASESPNSNESARSPRETAATPTIIEMRAEVDRLHAIVQALTTACEAFVKPDYSAWLLRYAAAVDMAKAAIAKARGEKP